MSVRFTDKDHGWEEIRKEIAAAKGGPHVVVGVFGEKAKNGPPVEAKILRDRAWNIAVATAHEFGLDIQHPGGTAYVPGGRFVSNANATPDMPRTAAHVIPIPRRSFIADTVDANAKKITALCKNMAAAVLARTMTMEKALGTVGVYVQGLIRGRMNSGIPPPLKASTSARKGSSVPLIDTGQLRASIDFEVRRV